MAPSAKYLIVIAGPTAVGKTDLAIQLALHYKTVIISADSRQFYKQLDIGTAKPDQDQLKQVKHYFINNKDISELYGAGHFATEADQLLSDLFQEHQVIVLTGGSGMYINALLHGVDDFQNIPLAVREKLNHEYKEHGIEALQQKLKTLDPDYYANVDLKNPQRIIRALEVCLHTGQPYSSYLRKTKKENPYTAIKILLNMEREQLYERIHQRVDHMFEKGLLEEVKGLLTYKHVNALKTVGYKELFEYLDGKCTLEEAKSLIKQHTRNYAKRQLTWFRHQDEYTEFHPSDTEKIKAYIDIIMRHG